MSVMKGSVLKIYKKHIIIAASGKEYEKNMEISNLDIAHCKSSSYHNSDIWL